MRSLHDAPTRDEVLSRLEQLRSESPRGWGRMTPHQMLCHLADSFRCAMGLREASPASSLLRRTLLRWVALHTPIPWPRGVPTRPELDARRGGSRPAGFDDDGRELRSLIVRFSTGSPAFEWAAHPLFGRLSEREWGHWGYRHADHHLRQFGVSGPR
jgi:hypothetical protein